MGGRLHGRHGLTDGAVVIAAITSCTNTSNPSVMIGAGLLAKKAVELGLKVPSYVKTSLAPGSKVVTRYLENLELMPYLQALGFHVVGYGCTSCIGNSGPLPAEVAAAVRDGDLVVASVLSGNRNFEGRVHPLTRVNYLASPPLVVAYALAGTVNIDLPNEPIGFDPNEQPVLLQDIWPTSDEIREAMNRAVSAELYATEYRDVFRGDETWNQIAVPEGDLYRWDSASTYIQEPPFFLHLTREEPPVAPIKGARVLALLGDSVTTDHISPAGSIPADGPAGRYLIEHGVERSEFNSFGSRRGNHEVMMRGTFANIRLRNQLVPGSEGGVHHSSPHRRTYEHLRGGDALPGGRHAAHRDRRQGIRHRKLARLGCQRHGLLGVKAVIAESYERIHRSNLVGMGVLPLQFLPGENAASLNLTGFETYNLEGVDDTLQPLQELTVVCSDEQRNVKRFVTTVRIDSPVEVDYYRNGGVLHTVLRRMATDATG